VRYSLSHPVYEAKEEELEEIIELCLLIGYKVLSSIDDVIEWVLYIDSRYRPIVKNFYSTITL
jgi:hypothetical protein